MLAAAAAAAVVTRLIKQALHTHTTEALLERTRTMTVTQVTLAAWLHHN
jgi:hypothetical protein